MGGLKHSRQREAILNYLKSTKSHPTAVSVYEHVRKIYPKISLGTVYRNLNLLVSSDEALKVNCGDGLEHFDGNPVIHYHFICNQCGCVLDLGIKDLDHINILAAASFDGKIHGHKTYFHGTCPKCYKDDINDRNDY